MQRLLRSARWDADAVRDEVRSYVVEHLGTPEDAGRRSDSGIPESVGLAECQCPVIPVGAWKTQLRVRQRSCVKLFRPGSVTAPWTVSSFGCGSDGTGWCCRSRIAPS